MQKNVASQKWVVFAYQDEGGTNPGEPVTGDAANITANVRIDGGAANAVDDTNPTELEDGYYVFDITAAESNGENIVICPASSTANVNVIGCPPAVYTTPANFPDFSVTATTGRVDVAAVAGTSQTANDNGADINAILVDTGTTIPGILGTPAGADLATDVAAVKTDTAAVLLDTGTDGVVVAAASKTGYRLSATGVDDIFDEPLAGHIAAGSFGAAAYVIRSNTAQAGASTTITLDASASATDDFYNNQRIFVVDGTGAGQGTYITDYNGTTKVATVQDTWRTNPSSDSVFVIVPAGGIPGASAPTAAAVADAVWDEARSDHTAEGSFGAMLYAPHEGTAQAATASTITLDATGSSSTNDFYNYSFIKIIAGTGAGQCRQISDYVGSTKVATVSLNWTTTPSTDSQYIVMTDFGIDAATVASIADGVWDEARSGHVTAGTFGEYVLADAVRVSGAAAAADGLEAAVSGATPLPANVTQVSGVAEDLPTATALATVDTNVDAILVDTGTTIPAQISALNDVSVSDILTTAMTESYNTDGSAMTLAQALYLIAQRLTESEVSGTTLTVKQLDGSTTAYTVTLDNGTNPTSMTRAT